MSILLDTERTLDVVTAEDTILYALSVQTLKNMLGDNFRDRLFLNCLMNCFSNSSCFNKLNTSIVENAWKSFKIMDYAKDEKVLKKGVKVSEQILAVIEGNLINVK